MKGLKRSLLKRYFSDELLLRLFEITLLSIDNNSKGALIKEALTLNNVPFSSLGSGTNRLGLMIDGYAVKFALDDDGMIDNQREFKYTKILQPYVIKVYEIMPISGEAKGLIAVTEYVQPFDAGDLERYRTEMSEILTDITRAFLMGDCGITSKNYGNWGVRPLTKQIVILDFAYIYSVKFKIFQCTCEESPALIYDSNFVKLICPHCKKNYSFGEIRRRITRNNQKEEIGDLEKYSYIIHKDNDEVEIIPEFEPVKNTLSEKELRKKQVKKSRKKFVKKLK